MKDIIIAAGYATRLYPLTENFPKPLLKVGSRNILERMLDDIDPIEDIDEHIIVTNHRFAGHFEEWKKTASYSKTITIVDDGTTSNDNRLGAVGDLLLALKKCGVDDEDIMVLAADNILSFSFKGFIDYFHAKGTSVIMCHHEPELHRLQRTGVITVDGSMRVTSMHEKPNVPPSNLAVPPFYIYSRADLPLIKSSLDHGCGFDAPGNLARHLASQTVLHAWEMPGTRFDIGSLDSYHEAQTIFG